MWEAVAAPGRGAELAQWVRTAAPLGSRVYASVDERVVIIAPAPLTLPEPPADLLARAPHAWDFTEVDGGEPTA